MFKKIPATERIPAMRHYSAIYRAEGEKELVPHKRTNTASFCANTWLRNRVTNGNIRKSTILAI